MITIVDYDAGNLTSVKRALDSLGIPCEITPDPDRVASARRIIFPGVGHATQAMNTLKARGLDHAIRSAQSRGTPIMGICIGAQILLDRSEEGDTPCLGIIPGTCVRFDLADKSLKVPHMGWDSITVSRLHPLLDGITNGDQFYFVHSYYPSPSSPDHVLARCSYETDFPAMIGRDNVVATQFHPEKSGRPGLAMLRNFSSWNGRLTSGGDPC